MAWEKAKGPRPDQPDNSIALFKNEEKNTKDHPDYRGGGKINGRDYWASAWINISKKDGRKYLSVKFKPKEGAATYKREQREERGEPFHDDEIPF